MAEENTIQTIIQVLEVLLEQAKMSEEEKRQIFKTPTKA